MLKRRSEYKVYLNFFIILSMCLLLIVRPVVAEASNPGWDAALATIDQLHDSFSVLEFSNKQDKQQTQVLRKQNNDRLKEINLKLQLIDKSKLDKLKSEADQAKNKYAPLLKDYTELGKKASEARKNKNKKSALLFDLKRNRIKASVDSARQEIKIKKDALSSAKKQASAKIKIVKDALLPVQTFKKQITAENKKITESNKIRIAADKSYKTAVKRGDALTVVAEMKSIIGELGRIRTSQKKIFEWEVNIKNAIYAAEGKLSK